MMLSLSQPGYIGMKWLGFTCEVTQEICHRIYFANFHTKTLGKAQHWPETKLINLVRDVAEWEKSLKELSSRTFIFSPVV